MAKRVLGGGKGSGPSLLVSPAPSTSLSPRGLSPAPSTASFNSGASSPRTSTDVQDLATIVALQQNSPTPAGLAAAPSKLTCPICNEEMVTLLQLNRHLDDDHKNLEEVKQDEVKDWFQKQVFKAKKFQPLAVINQKLKKLDVFESNISTTPAPVSSTPSTPQRNGQPPRTPEPQRIIDPDEIVTRDHWQKPSGNDECSDPVCGKRLNATNGRINCRHCGKLFCEEHTMYQMKLSRSANHEPVRGVWCRVCETCFKSREGYNDRTGTSRDHFAEFKALRAQKVDRMTLEIARLEKRVTRLTQLLAQVPESSSSSGLFGLLGGKDPRRELEQSVVTWEDDTSVDACPFCHQTFSSYGFRRSHCRTCGRVVCNDPYTQCSEEVPLETDGPSPSLDKTTSRVILPLRMCKDCRSTLFGRKDFEEEAKRRPPDVRSYENLVQFERGIRLLLPRFQKLLTALQDPDRPPSPAQISEASKVRKRLVDSFTQYDSVARRIRDLPTQVRAQQELQKAIYQQATTFLHIHMLPLKALPKILKHATPSRPQQNGSLQVQGQGHNRKSSLAQIMNARQDLDGSSQQSSSSAVSALQEEEKALQEKLIVLEEQKFLVDEMIASANKRRNFEVVSALSINAIDLGTEIDKLKGMLAGVELDFRDVYTGNTDGTT